MPRVSVIIPAYGHAEYILQTLDSVFAQTFRDYEVIVVNDGSPDQTAEVLAPLIQAGRIRYFEQKNQGVAAARNFGISQAAGEYIALLDDDDLWPPDKLEWQQAWLRNNDAIAVGGNVVTLDTNQELVEQRPRVDVGSLDLNCFFQGNPFTSPGQVMFRRSAYEAGARFDPEIWGADDLDFWIELARIGTIDFLDRNALTYRLHRSNASINRVRMMENSGKLLRKRIAQLTGEQRKRCARSGYDWLFTYLGYQLIQESSLYMVTRRFRPSVGFSLLRSLSKSFSGAKTEAPEIHRKVRAEVRRSIVARLKNSIHGLLGHRITDG